MSHSLLSRKSLGMAVAIAVGITATPAITTAGPLATITPVAQAQDFGFNEIHLKDDIVDNINVHTEGDPENQSIVINKGDVHTSANPDYMVDIKFRVPDNLDFSNDKAYHYDITFDNLTVGNEKTIRPKGQTVGNDIASGQIEGTNSQTISFIFEPGSKGKVVEFEFAASSYPNKIATKTPVAIKGQKKTLLNWTVTPPSEDKPDTNTVTPGTDKPSTDKPSTDKPGTAPTGDISAIDKNSKGDYTITTANGKKYTMQVGTLAKELDTLNTLVKKQRVDIDKLSAADKDTLNKTEAKLKATQKALDKLKAQVEAGEGDSTTQQKTLAKVSKDVATTKNELTTVHNAIANLTAQDIKEIRDNGDGSYTLIRNDGTEVHGNIAPQNDAATAVESVTTDDAGNLVITRPGGETETVELNRTTVKATTEGDKNLVTITTASGPVTFETGNTYITDVIKTDDGNFEIHRNDIDGVWKTIDLTDLRQEITQTKDRVAALKAEQDKANAKQDEANAKQQAQHKKDIAALNTRIDSAEKKLAKAETEITALKGRATKVEKRVTDIENSINTIGKDIVTINKAIDVLDKRVTDLETHDKDWAKCYSGIGQAAIPMALAVPLGFLAGLDLPGFDAANANFQRQIGAFNPQAATWLGENRDAVRAAAGVLGLASVIGIIAHAATTCQDYNNSNAAKDTDLAVASSKLAEGFGAKDKDKAGAKAESESKAGDAKDAEK